MTGGQKLTAPIADIATGERSRRDVGDLAELAESITAVGLLHPVVVTADMQLVAGGRRLAAVRHLGWTDVPVTVVDLADAAAALRAEADENECRKALTPLEAAVMRERRAAVLAGEAAKRKADAGKEHGRGRPKASSNLDEAKPTPTANATRKVAAIGTGYSGSTLDKVDEIREWASDDGTFGGAPIPEAAKPVAEKALRAVNQPGAAVSREHQQAKQAIAEMMEADPDIAAATFMRDASKAIKRLGDAAQHLAGIDPDRMADLMEDYHLIGADGAARSVTEWISRVRKARSTLRVVNGGKS